MEMADEGSIRCGVCSHNCLTYRKLRRHYKKTHPEYDLLSCPFCRFVTVDQNEMRKHKKVEHRQDKIGCSCCDLSTKSWRKWKLHVDNMHPSDVADHTHETTSSQITECSNQAHTVSGSSPIGKSPKKNMSGHRVKNTDLQDLGKDLSSCTTDEATNLAFNSDQKSQSALPSYSGQQESSGCNITNHKCVTYGKYFACAQSLSHHQQEHTDTQLYMCSFCNFSNNDFSSLKYHALTHAGVTPFYCELCHKMFTRKISLKYHKRTHNGSRPFQCPYCEYTAAVKSTLDQHIRGHLGIRPYKCKLCDYASAYRSNLLCHYAKHSTDRPFPCELCTKQFKRKDHLQAHTRSRHELKL